jgi:hypothetical protein
MRRPNLAGPAKFVVIASLAGAFAGCSSKNAGTFDQPEPTNISTRMANLLAFNKLTGEPLPKKPEEQLECPEIIVLDGTAAHRVYNGAESNDTLKYQYSLGDVARQCILQGNQIAMKVGIEGQVLLGPAGTPGSFTVPIRVAVVRETDDVPLVSKLYTASDNVAPGQTEGSFTIVTEPLLAPFVQQHTAEDYSIKVGIDTGGGLPKSTPRAKKKHG